MIEYKLRFSRADKMVSSWGSAKRYTGLGTIPLVVPTRTLFRSVQLISHSPVSTAFYELTYAAHDMQQVSTETSSQSCCGWPLGIRYSVAPAAVVFLAFAKAKTLGNRLATI